jgi:hypothetical protein
MYYPNVATLKVSGMNIKCVSINNSSYAFNVPNMEISTTT